MILLLSFIFITTPVHAESIEGSPEKPNLGITTEDLDSDKGLAEYGQEPEPEVKEEVTPDIETNQEAENEIVTENDIHRELGKTIVIIGIGFVLGVVLLTIISKYAYNKLM